MPLAVGEIGGGGGGVLKHHHFPQVSVEALEEVLEEQRQLATSQLQPLVAVVVTIVQEALIHDSIQSAAHHQGYVHHLKCKHSPKSAILYV